MDMKHMDVARISQGPDAQDRSRAYKSRNKRPCDFCRYKKAACHLDSNPPCELCIRYGKECTFVESPAKRRRPNEERSFESLPQLTDMHNEIFSWDPPMATFSPQLSNDFGFDPSTYEPIIFEQFDPVNAGIAAPPTETSPSLPFDPGNSEEPSLDAQVSSNAQLVGFSGEQDPFLSRHYKYDGNNECHFQQSRMRRVGENDGIPVHFMIQPNKLASKAQPTESQDKLDARRTEVQEMVSDDVGCRLIRLFFQYIHPYFPISSRERCMRDGEFSPESIPTHLLAAIYGHALPFCIFDEKLCVEVYTPPSADKSFVCAWLAANVRLHTPSSSLVQTLLSLVQRRPTNKHVADTPYKWAMMAIAVAAAQALGSNLDPSEWPSPLWEQRSRRRVAWALYSQEKWSSSNFGRSSHISPDDWDVPSLRPADFEEFDSGDSAPTEHFLRSCSSSEIVDNVSRNSFSVRATRALCNSLDLTLEVAKPLRIQLTEWFTSLPSHLKTATSTSTSTGRKEHQSIGHGSSHSAYITAKTESFRAMSRPRVAEANAPAASASRTGAIAIAREVFEFLEGSDADYLEAFWPSYARTNFTIASNFMLLLFASSPNPADAKECSHSLNSWRGSLRIKSRSCDLSNSALSRSDATFVAGSDRSIELSPSASQVWSEQGE